MKCFSCFMPQWWKRKKHFLRLKLSYQLISLETLLKTLSWSISSFVTARWGNYFEFGNRKPIISIDIASPSFQLDSVLYSKLSKLFPISDVFLILVISTIRRFHALPFHDDIELFIVTSAPVIRLNPFECR